MENEDQIIWVSEAFAMQPKGWMVGERCSTGQTLLKIVRESVYDTGDPFEYYVGYDSTGKRAFQIRVQCATVEFK